MRSIKTKLILSTTALIITILGVGAFLLIEQKEKELTHDLFVNSNAFAELTSSDVVSYYNSYLAENSFVYFNREIQGIFQKNSDISFIKVVSYGGGLLYDSLTEKEKQYDVGGRTYDSKYLAQVQSQYPSIRTSGTDRALFLQRDQAGNLVFVDQNGGPIESLGEDERIYAIFYPVDSAFSVVYGLSYRQLDQRIMEMRNNIIMLAVFALMIGIFLSWFLATKMTRPLKRMTAGAQMIGLGNFKVRIPVETNDEISTLATTFNQMAKTLEVTTKALVYEERVKKELELAAKIQKDILPKTVPKIRGLDISAGLLPAEEIGGDCYDFIALDNGCWIFYLGDVTGHGVPSGIVVSIANAMFFRSSDQDDLTKILVDVNYVLKAKTSSNMFLTLVLLKWNQETQKMTYVSAGHEPMFHYRAETGEIEECPRGGIALGMFDDIGSRLEVNTVDLKSGDFLVVYSDGIPEAWRSRDEMYGMARFKDSVKNCVNLKGASAIRNEILADVKGFTGHHKQMDDITLMVIKKA